MEGGSGHGLGYRVLLALLFTGGTFLARFIAELLDDFKTSTSRALIFIDRHTILTNEEKANGILSLKYTKVAHSQEGFAIFGAKSLLMPLWIATSGAFFN